VLPQHDVPLGRLQRCLVLIDREQDPLTAAERPGLAEAESGRLAPDQLVEDRVPGQAILQPSLPAVVEETGAG
jgi:hypothetical protein